MICLSGKQCFDDIAQDHAKIVFDSNHNEIIMLGLDVTRKLPLNPKLENILETSNNELANFFKSCIFHC